MEDETLSEHASAPVRLGVVGAGWWATEYHIPGAMAHPQARLVAVSDSHPGRLQKATEAFGLSRTYHDYREMLAREQLDGVIVVTPHATHHAIARECLAAGCHVLIEKPMTLFAWEARDLLDLAAQKNRQIMIGYTQHHYVHTQRARQVIASGQFGPVEYVNCSFCSDMTGLLGGNISPQNSPMHHTVTGPSEFYNRPEMLGGGHGHLQLTHLIGLLLYITGLRARRVQAMMNNLGRRVDMVDVISVEFANGALGLIGGTGNSNRNRRISMEVFCREGCYLFDSVSGLAALRTADGAEEHLKLTPLSDQRSAVTHNFVDVILGKAENLAPGEVGWRAVEVLDAAYRSARENGRPVTIEELYR